MTRNRKLTAEQRDAIQVAAIAGGAFVLLILGVVGLSAIGIVKIEPLRFEVLRDAETNDR